ncbi:MAG: TonB-dependent receptor plug domain-containing protein [Massilia sp.]
MPTIRLRGAARAAALLTLSVSAHAALAADRELTSLSLEQLSDVVITSVSRQEERLANAAASVFIISSNDIARSGARTLPEALRLAPNLQVAHTDARNYAITARGFNSVFANKLLVLIDGRSIYSPLFSGVFWDVQDVVMADIERIEVISGPGATIYGSNAVNGVINIITKSAKDTQGGLAAAAGGAHEQVGTLRYGGRLPSNGHFRVYGKTLREESTRAENGRETRTGFARRQAGFRADWDLAQAGLALSGDAYDGALEQLGTRDIRVAGANLSGTVSARLEGGSELRAQLIVDHVERDQPNAYDDHLNTVDLELQHNVRIGERHRLAWGGGYRYSLDRISANGNAFAFLPPELSMHWGNAFVQDEIDLGRGIKATLGLKGEHNNYTGFEYLPNVRLAWTPDSTRLWWTSLSRTVRAPSRIDRDLFAPATPIMAGGVPRYAIGGGPDFVSEVAKVLELGYRAQPMEQLSYSVTAFVSDYDKLRTVEPQATGPTIFRNLGEGRVRGVEAWWRWQPVERWRLVGGVVAQHVGTSLAPNSRDLTGATGLATGDPARRWTLRSSLDISDFHQLDVTLRYTSRLPNPAVPGYYEMDAEWSWKAMPGLDVSLIGQNLLHASHPEFGAPGGRSAFERALLLKVVKRF